MDIAYSELRQHLKEAIDKVAETHEPYIITSNKKKKAVLLSFEDYQALEETAYLLRNPVMAKRLIDAVADLKIGNNIQERRIIDEA